MPPFESPSPPFRSSQLRTWFDNVEPKLRDPNLLFRRLHEKFNTITIPVLRESDYFNNIIRIAKLAGGREADIERIYKEENKQQREKLKSLLARAANQTIYNNDIFPCAEARDTVADVCITGCLLDFLRLLKGNAFGWEADAAEDMELGGATGNLSEEKPADQTQGFYHENMHGPYDGTQWPDDDYYYETPMERRIREEQSANATYYIGTISYARCTTPISNGTDVLLSDASISELENNEINENKASTGHTKRKRTGTDCDFDDARGPRRELTSITSSSTTYASTQQAIDNSATDDNSALDDDDGYGHVNKRRKFENTLALESISIKPSSQLAADNDTSKKRSRSNDYDKHEHRHKRPKLESPCTYAPSHASSNLQQLTEKAALKKSRPKNNNIQRCSSRKRKNSSLKISRSPGPANTRLKEARPANTRSKKTGRSKFLELDQSGAVWEFDQSGKRRLISNR